MNADLDFDATNVVITYDCLRGDHCIVVERYLSDDPNASVVRIRGTVTDLRGVVDTMDRLLDDLGDGAG